MGGCDPWGWGATGTEASHDLGAGARVEGGGLPEGRGRRVEVGWDDT